MLEIVFAVTMLIFSLLVSALIVFSLYCVVNFVLEKIIGTNIADVWDYSIAAIINGIRSFLNN